MQDGKSVCGIHNEIVEKFDELQKITAKNEEKMRKSLHYINDNMQKLFDQLELNSVVKVKNGMEKELSVPDALANVWEATVVQRTQLDLQNSQVYKDKQNYKRWIIGIVITVLLSIFGYMGTSIISNQAKLSDNQDRIILQLNTLEGQTTRTVSDVNWLLSQHSLNNQIPHN